VNSEYCRVRIVKKEGIGARRLRRDPPCLQVQEPPLPSRKGSRITPLAMTKSLQEPTTSLMLAKSWWKINDEYSAHGAEVLSYD